MPVLRAFRIQPISYRLAPESPKNGQRRVPFRPGWNASPSRHMGVMARLDAGPKPPRSKAAHRRALRATPAFKTMNLAYFFCVNLKKWEFIFKDGGRA